MSLRPCLACGEPVAGSYCEDCQPARPSSSERDKPAVHRNPAAWKALSKRVRRLQPWCLDCGATEHLQGDHIIPVKIAPELALVVENVTVRCATCNGRRQDRLTVADAEGVLDALRRVVERRPSRAGRERVAVAERVLAEVGGPPKVGAVRRAAKAQGAMDSPNRLHHNDLQSKFSSLVESSSRTRALSGDCEVPCEVG